MPKLKDAEQNPAIAPYNSTADGSKMTAEERGAMIRSGFDRGVESCQTALALQDGREPRAGIIAVIRESQTDCNPTIARVGSRRSQVRLLNYMLRDLIENAAEAASEEVSEARDQVSSIIGATLTTMLEAYSELPDTIKSAEFERSLHVAALVLAADVITHSPADVALLSKALRSELAALQAGAQVTEG